MIPTKPNHITSFLWKLAGRHARHMRTPGFTRPLIRLVEDRVYKTCMQKYNLTIPTSWATKLRDTFLLASPSFAPVIRSGIPHSTEYMSIHLCIVLPHDGSRMHFAAGTSCDREMAKEATTSEDEVVKLEQVRTSSAHVYPNTSAVNTPATLWTAATLNLATSTL